jgi:hypothetical protein
VSRKTTYFGNFTGELIADRGKAGFAHARASFSFVFTRSEKLLLGESLLCFKGELPSASFCAGNPWAKINLRPAHIARNGSFWIIRERQLEGKNISTCWVQKAARTEVVASRLPPPHRRQEFSFYPSQNKLASKTFFFHLQIKSLCGMNLCCHIFAVEMKSQIRAINSASVERARQLP